MEKADPERVKKTLDFIAKDKVIPEDPWFYSRLIARMENETEKAQPKPLAVAIALRLRPILAVVVVLIGIASGIALGRVLSAPSGSQEPTASIFSSEEDANAAIFREIGGSMDEQILLMK